MRYGWLLPALLAVPAWAEDPIVATPLPPVGTAPAAPVAPAPPPPVPWLPKPVAQVQALDKVNARASLLTIKVGESATFGSLTIAVKGCAVRPADVPADATAFLAVTDSTPNVPGFSGWMLKSVPSVSMLAHPIYDLRVVGCSG